MHSLTTGRGVAFAYEFFKRSPRASNTLWDGKKCFQPALKKKNLRQLLVRTRQTWAWGRAAVSALPGFLFFTYFWRLLLSFQRPVKGMRRLFFSHVATAALCCHALPKVMRSRLAALARTLAPTLSQVACLVNNTGKHMQHPRGLPGGVPPSRASFSSPHPTPASPHATPRLWDSGPARSLHFLLCKCVPVPRQLKWHSVDSAQRSD